MTSKKQARRALVASFTSLLLCFAMLIGTTFAWFTDTEVSGRNVIKAGNLDVVLEYKTDVDADWTPVTKDTKLFKEGALYEPGYTEVVFLRVSNAGSLALKYQLTTNIYDETTSINVMDDSFSLKDYLEIGYYTMDEYNGDFNYADILLPVMFGTREAALSNVTTKTLAADTGVIGTDAPILAGDKTAQVVAVVLTMPETVGNEANYKVGAPIPFVDLGVTLVATQLSKEEDTFGNQYDKDAVYPVATVEEFQTALDEAGDGDVIQFSSDFAGDVTLPQKKDVNVVIDGNGHKFSGSLLVDGKSATYTGAGLTIKNVNFSADTISTDACIQLGNGTNATRYTCNVTIEGCTFDVPGVVGVKSYTGGDKNVTIKDCVATERAHSLAQLKGVDGVVVENCTVNSVRGINLNNSNNVKIVDSTFDVEKYAVRFGESANSVQEVFEITNCTLTSDNVDGDAVIVLRAGATDATLTLTNTTLNGAIQMTGHENATIIVG